MQSDAIDVEKFALRFLRQLRQLAQGVSRISIVSCDFFIHSIFDFLDKSMRMRVG